MTHAQMSRFRKYRLGTPELQAMALAVAQFAEVEYGATPRETQNWYLRFPNNFLLIETIHSRQTSLTINVAGERR